MSVDLHALKIELTTDPQALGLPIMSDQAATDALNLVRAGAAFQINSAPITAAVFFSHLDPTEYLALTQLKLLQLQCVFLASPLDLSDASTKSILLGIFTASPLSTASVSALIKRQASRMEVIFGRDVKIAVSDVFNARNGAW